MFLMIQSLTNKPGELPILEISDVLRGNQGIQIMMIRLEPRDVHSVGIHFFLKMLALKKLFRLQVAGKH